MLISLYSKAIEKLLENSELRDKYEKQLLELKKEEPLIRLKSITNQQSITTISFWEAAP